MVAGDIKSQKVEAYNWLVFFLYKNNLFQLFFQTLFNPEGSVLQLIHIPYDFSDMPRSSRTFLRQKSIFNESKKLRYLIHLRLDFDIVNIISNENITQKFQFTIKWSIFSTSFSELWAPQKEPSCFCMVKSKLYSRAHIECKF